MKKVKQFARYEEAKAFRATCIRFGYTTSLSKDWQGLYIVSYK